MKVLIKIIDRVYSVIYIYNPISAGRNLAHKEKKTNGRCKRFHDRELPLPTSRYLDFHIINQHTNDDKNQ